MKRVKKAKVAKQPRRPQPAQAEPRDEAADVPEIEEADAAGLQEVESELGISEWIDPDTGAPAEDSVPRIEDH